VDPAVRRRLKQVEAKQRLEAIRQRGVVRRIVLTVWAALSDYGQSGVRLVATALLLLSVSAAWLTVPEYGVEGKARCPAQHADLVMGRLVKPGGTCISESFRRLNYDEALVETAAIWTTGSTLRTKGRNWPAATAILVVAGVGIIVLTLVLTVVTYNVVRLSRP
jgi:hypothetical protein